MSDVSYELYNKAIAMVHSNKRSIRQLTVQKRAVEMTMHVYDIGDNMYNALLDELNMINSDLDQRNAANFSAHNHLFLKGRDGAEDVIDMIEYVENQSSC